MNGNLTFANIEYNPESGDFYRNGKIITRTDGSGYRQINIKNKSFRGHTLAWFLVTSKWPERLDHSDGNRLNNAISNLRECTVSENNRNSKLKSSNTSGVKNVYWNKSKQKWFVQLRTNYGRIWLGMHEDLELAELIATEARDFYHGQFARHK